MTVAAERYLPLARSIARRYAAGHCDLADELRSEALLALAQAATTFDPARGTTPATWVRAQVDGACRNLIRAERSRRRREERAARPDRARDSGDPFGGALDLLTPRQAEAVRLIATGLNSAEAGRELGVGREAVKQRVRTAADRLGDALGIDPAALRLALHGVGRGKLGRPGHPQTPEARARLSASLAGRPKTPAHRAAISRGRRARRARTGN